MNKIFRIVWSPTLQSWVAVSELAKARGKGKNGKNKLGSLTAGVLGAITLVLIPLENARAWVADTGTSTAALDGNIASNTSINGGMANPTAGGAIAVGPTAQAQYTNSIAMGNNAKTGQPSSVAIGDTATTKGIGDIAIGYGATTGTIAPTVGTTASAIAIGSGTFSSWGVAIGDQAQNSSLSYGVSIGRRTLSGLRSVALGWTATAKGIGAIGIGDFGTYADGNAGIALNGKVASAATNGVAIGSGSSASVNDSLALGSNAVATTAAGVAGYDPLTSAITTRASSAWVSTLGAVSIGNAAGTVTRQINGVAAGTQLTDAVNVAQLQATQDHYLSVNDGGSIGGNYNNDGATGVNSIASGVGASATALASSSYGNGSSASGEAALALGQNATASSINSIAQGLNSLTTSGSGVAIGQTAKALVDPADATTTGAIAIGWDALSNARDSVAVGASSQATKKQAFAMGGGANASAETATAIGALTNATGTGSVALGNLASSTSRSGIAIGQQSQALSDVANPLSSGAMAIGFKSTAAAKDTLALGSSSSATKTQAFALGTLASASGTASTAIGTNSKATAGGAIAFGVNTQATGSNSIAQGNGAIANTLNAISIGLNSVASGQGSVVLGGDAGLASTATVADGVALGSGSVASTAAGVAGYDPKTSGTSKNTSAIWTSTLGAVSVGDIASNRTRQINGVAAGTLATDAVNVAQLQDAQTHYYSVNDSGTVGGNYNNDGATGNNSLAAGINAKASSNDTVALGSNVNAGSAVNDPLASGMIAIGSKTSATDAGAIAIGSGNSAATGRTSIVLGTSSLASQLNAIAMGTTAQAIANNAIAIGQDAQSSSNYGIAMGYSTRAGADAATAGDLGTGALAIGDSAKAFGTGATAFGYSAGAAGPTSTAIGAYSSASKQSASAFGYLANASGSGSTAVGNNSTASGDYGTAIGRSASASGVASTAIGRSSSSTGVNSAAIGAGATAGAANSLALGLNANANFAGSVALGAGSVTRAAVGTAGTTITGKNYTFAGSNPASTVSVGDVGAERTITNVAAGRLQVDSTDAINGSQLFATNTAINSLDAGSVKYDTHVDGTVNYNSITLGGDTYDNSTHTGGTTITNVADGVAPSDAVNFSQLTETNNNINNIYTTGTRYFHANSTGADSQALGLDSVAIGMGAVSANANDVALGSGSVSGATTGTSGVTLQGVDYTFAGANPASQVSVGAAGSERLVTNVAAGHIAADSTDAINGSQLFATNTAINSLDAGSVKYDTHVDGTVNYNSITLGGDTYDNSTHTGGTTITNVADGVAPSDAVNFSQLTETNNNINNIYTTGTRYFHANSTGADSQALGLDSVAIGMGAVSANANDVALGSGSVSGATTGTSGVTLQGVDYTFAGANPASQVSVGAAGSERLVTNVAAGHIAADSTDAINGSQLFATNTAINSLDAGSVKYDTHVDGTVNYNSVTLGGDTYDNSTHTGGTTITNVADGVAPSDAVNFSQLTETNNNINNIYTTGTRYFHANSTGADSQALGLDSVAIGMGAVSANANDVALGSGSVSGATTGTSGVTLQGVDYTFAGANPASQVSVGAAGSERLVTNVAAGHIAADSTDAINGSQLFATNTAINSLDAGSVKYDTHVDGTVNYNSVTLGGDTYDNSTHTGGTTITNVADGVAPSDAVNFSQLTETNNNINNIYTTGTRYFHANSTGADSQALGLDSVAIGMGAVSANANDVALGSGSVSGATTGTSGVTLQGVDYTFAGANPASQVSVGAAGSERLVTNVAAGHIAADSTDAINGSQLFATNTAINSLDAGSVKYDTHVDGTVNYNSVTLGGDTYDNSTHTGGTTITNVANGVNDSDAVNMSQLNDTNTNVNNITDTVNNFAGDQTENNTEINGRGIRYVRTNDTGLPQLDAYANGQGSTALGYNARATGMDSLAMGRNALSLNDGDVALGAGSVTEAAVATTGTTLNGQDYTFAGINPLSTVSVGSRGHERTITNVAAGRISDSSTDAINGSQLFATNTAINMLDKGTVKYDTNIDGTVNYNHITLGGDTYNSITKNGGTRITNVAYGTDPSDAVNVQQLNDATTNIYVNGTKYFHANSVKADSVASGTDSIAVGPEAKAYGQSSIAMGDGATSSGQGSISLGQNSQTQAENSVAMGTGAIAKNANDVALGAGSVTQSAVATSSITINGDAYAVAGNNPASTVSVGSKGNERTITNVAAGRISADSTDAVNGSELYATNQSIEKISGDINNLDAGSVKYETNNDGTVNYNKVIMGGDTYNNETHTGGTTITNVANGVAPDDAVNMYQLDQVNQSVTNIANGTDGMFQVNNTSNLPKPKPTGKDSAAGGAGAIASGDHSTALGTNARANHQNSVALGYNSVTDRDNSVSVGSAGNERQVTNVAAGTADTDAANVGQLKQGVNNSYQYTNKKFNDLKNMVDDQKDKLSAGIAGAMAVAGLPQPYVAGASMVGIAGGTYQGESAIALGVSTISDNGKWVTKLSGTTNSQGDVGAALGVGYQF
ncbi:YadA-like family protein (plasmid) [Escherichia coli]|uniref:YadA-like family protein n=1 Tax=Escherichia coli TaxID=562 RepID=UPI003134418F